jgi:hypothetical protein
MKSGIEVVSPQARISSNLPYWTARVDLKKGQKSNDTHHNAWADAETQRQVPNPPFQQVDASKFNRSSKS